MQTFIATRCHSQSLAVYITRCDVGPASLGMNVYPYEGKLGVRTMLQAHGTRFLNCTTCSNINAPISACAADLPHCRCGQSYDAHGVNPLNLATMSRYHEFSDACIESSNASADEPVTHPPQQLLISEGTGTSWHSCGRWKSNSLCTPLRLSGEVSRQEGAKSGEHRRNTAGGRGSASQR